MNKSIYSETANVVPSFDKIIIERLSKNIIFYRTRNVVWGATLNCTRLPIYENINEIIQNE